MRDACDPMHGCQLLVPKTCLRVLFAQNVNVCSISHSITIAKYTHIFSITSLRNKDDLDCKLRSDTPLGTDTVILRTHNPRKVEPDLTRMPIQGTDNVFVGTLLR